MTLRALLKICVAALVGLAIFGFSSDREPAIGEAEDRKLEAFIEAAAAVDSVMAAWQPKIAGADGDRAESLRLRANDEIRASIEQVDGISFAEYRDIRRAIATDPEMLARVTDIMRRQHQN
ncbi:MAG: hypothetical protein AAGA21_03550 [Pseudomonadota bacterium]